VQGCITSHGKEEGANKHLAAKVEERPTGGDGRGRGGQFQGKEVGYFIVCRLVYWKIFKIYPFISWENPSASWEIDFRNLKESECIGKWPIPCTKFEKNYLYRF